MFQVEPINHRDSNPNGIESSELKILPRCKRVTIRELSFQPPQLDELQRGFVNNERHDSAEESQRHAIDPETSLLLEQLVRGLNERGVGYQRLKEGDCAGRPVELLGLAQHYIFNLAWIVEADERGGQRAEEQLDERGFELFALLEGKHRGFFGLFVVGEEIGQVAGNAICCRVIVGGSGVWLWGDASVEDEHEGDGQDSTIEK